MAYPDFTPEELATEEWRNVSGYKEYYRVSNLGRVLRAGGTPKCRKDRILKSFLNKGYPHVAMCADGKKRQIGIHQLVAVSFIGPYPDGMEVNHIDHDRANPRLTNLEYRTHQANIRYAVEQNRISKKRPRKLTKEHIPIIRQMLQDGISQYEVSRQFKVSIGAISEIKHGRNWKHV